MFEDKKYNQNAKINSGNTSVFVFITEIIWQTFKRINWRSILDGVEGLNYCQQYATWCLEETNIQFGNGLKRQSVINVWPFCFDKELAKAEIWSWVEKFPPKASLKG